MKFCVIKKIERSYGKRTNNVKKKLGKAFCFYAIKTPKKKLQKEGDKTVKSNGEILVRRSDVKNSAHYTSE